MMDFAPSPKQPRLPLRVNVQVLYREPFNWRIVSLWLVLAVTCWLAVYGAVSLVRDLL